MHFYPFRTDREQGGTLRLRTAVTATEQLGPTTVVWFDAAGDRWRDGGERPAAAAPAHGSAHGLKRRVFPHTLFESGRHAVDALSRQASEHLDDDQDVVILHTSYLAPAIGALPSPPIVDVYDLVWRGHAIDADAAVLPLKVVRSAYSARTRRREEAALRRARGLVVAGWDDHERLRGLGVPSRWVPTGMSTTAVPRRPTGDRLRIGFLGNFAHQPTLDSAEALTSSPAARASDIEVVLGGWESDRHPSLRERGATVMGPVGDPADFWREVDVAVIPVFSGTGIKVKIAEAMLAGRNVVTTPLGAAGFDPEARKAMVVVDHLTDLDADACRAAADSAMSPADAAAGYALGPAAARYATFVLELS